jgi:uncharacterized protein YndB with AHSA1/START domain
MARFIAVIHGWHVHSRGFTVRELTAETAGEAARQACWIKDQREDTFDRCAYTIIEIEPGERLSRRLTWRERITGRTS